MIQLASQYREGRIASPPGIMAKKAEIAAATRNAELFMSRTGAVDYCGMINLVVALKLELDKLYGEWASESAVA